MVLDFHIEYDGQNYVARTVDIPLSAEGNTVERALHNLQAAVNLYYFSKGFSIAPNLAAYDVATCA